MSEKKGILQRLAEGPVVGDGSMCFILEKRGYAKAGPWTPEAVIEYPDAVLQLHKEYVRSGADVVQTASFYSNDDKLAYGRKGEEVIHTSAEINDAACKLAKKAADENGCLVCGGFSPVPSYKKSGVEAARVEYRKQAKVYQEHDVDFVMAEFFHDINEIELCASEMKKLNKPIALCMRVGLMGDVNGVSPEECAIRMAKTGAEIIGTNCSYDTDTSLKVMKRIVNALKKEDLHPYLICQPIGYVCPDAENSPIGFYSLIEYPLCLDPRSMTRIEAHKFAREAWEIGVRYIGGCCGFEPHHIRAIAQELAAERGRKPPVEDMAQAFGGEYFKTSLVSDIASGETATREYWMNMKPGFGRPFNPSCSKPKEVKFN
ncbi:betaine--homocysteine S-methyltransferase 1-like [Styela clava]